MKIVHVIAPGGLAGAERLVLGGVAALRAAGEDARLVVLDEVRAPGVSVPFQDAARTLAIPLDVVPVVSRLDRQARAALRALTFDADVLHLHGYKALALATRPVHGVWLATHHGDTGHTRTARLYEALARLLYRRLDAVVAVSAETATALRLPHVRTIANFLTIQAQPTPPPAHPVPQLLVLGRLSVEKGVDVLLQALAEPEMPPIALAVVGDGPERAPLAALAQTLGVTVQFHGFQTDVLPFLAQCDAVCMPSLREGMPLAALEALCAGRPLLASAVGALPELVQLGAGGTVPPGDAHLLALLLRQWLANQPAWRARALAQADAVRARFSPQTWAQQTLSHYRALQAPHRR